jgi:mevalonate kinase
VFDQIAAISEQAAQAMASGDTPALGPLMNSNHELLVQLQVSSPELEALVQAARQAGALGAKLSGAGRGGNMIAQVWPEEAQRVAAALEHAGAKSVIATCVEASADAGSESQAPTAC